MAYTFPMLGLAKNRAVAALLVLWVALAPAFAVFPAAAMAMEMSLSSAASPDCCDGCQPDEIDCDICTVMCRMAAQAATEADQDRPVIALLESGTSMRQPAPPGRAPPPEPAPPKPVPHI